MHAEGARQRLSPAVPPGPRSRSIAPLLRPFLAPSLPALLLASLARDAEGERGLQLGRAALSPTPAPLASFAPRARRVACRGSASFPRRALAGAALQEGASSPGVGGRGVPCELSGRRPARDWDQPRCASPGISCKSYFGGASSIGLVQLPSGIWPGSLPPPPGIPPAPPWDSPDPLYLRSLSRVSLPGSATCEVCFPYRPRPRRLPLAVPASHYITGLASLRATSAAGESQRREGCPFGAGRRLGRLLGRRRHQSGGGGRPKA